MVPGRKTKLKLLPSKKNEKKDAEDLPPSTAPPATNAAPVPPSKVT